MAVSMRLGRTVAARASVARRARAVAGTFRGRGQKRLGKLGPLGTYRAAHPRPRRSVRWRLLMFMAHT